MRSTYLPPGNYIIAPRRNYRSTRFGKESRYTASIRVASAGGISGAVSWISLTFHLALRYTHKITAPPDAWFVMTDPPLLVTTVLKLRSHLGGRVIHHVDDVYPDLAMALGSLPSPGLVVISPGPLGQSRAERL